MQTSETSHAAAENQELSKALDAFQDYLLRQNMASNTITAYVYGVKHFYSCYDRLSPDNISLYKVRSPSWIITNRRPSTYASGH